MTDATRDAWLHRLMAGLGALIVAILAAILVGETLDGEGAPPDIRAEATGIERAGEAWVVKLRAENRGDNTAAEVTIEGRLGNGETAQLTLDYVPDGSSRTGGLVFRSDPGANGLTLRVLGYRDP